MPSAVRRARSQLRQKGCVTELMTPNVVPSPSRKRSAGALSVRGRASTGPNAGGDPFEHRRARHDAFGPPVGGAADVSVLDEAQLGAVAARVVEQGRQLAVVDAGDHHRVELQLREAGTARRRGDAVEHPAEVVAPRQHAERVAIERVEADRDPVQAGRAQRRGMLAQQHAVAGHRQVGDRGPVRGVFTATPAGRHAAAVRRR